MPSADPLKRLREIRDQLEEAEALVPERDRCIREAAGHASLRKIAEAAGLSKSRVAQILDE